MTDEPVFTAPAARRWSELGGSLQTQLLNNVWCVKCRSGTTIVHYTGKMEHDNLVLEGRCIKCGGRVARVIEGS